MQVTKTDIDQLNAVLKLTVEQPDYQEEVEKQLKTYRQKANIPGFRPGKVPASLVKKMFGRAILGEAVNNAINKGVYDYIKENNLNVLGDPMPHVEENEPAYDWDKDTTFEFSFDIALAPAIDVKLSARNKIPYYTVVVDDTMVDNQVKAYQSRFGEYVEADEYVEGDFLKGTLTEQVENGRVIENAMIMPTYMTDKKQVKLFVKAKKGDIITFNPKKAFDNEAELTSLLKMTKEEVAALTADFQFEVTSITRHQDAAIDEKLFFNVYADDKLKKEADFRARIKAEIESNMLEESEYKFGLDVKAAIMKKMEKVAFPEDFLKRWALATNEKMTAEQLDKEFPQMIEELKWQLAKDALMKDADIKVEDADLEAYARKVARMQLMQYGMMHAEEEMLQNFVKHILGDKQQVRGIFDRVCEEKVYAYLKGIVKLEEKSISYEEFGKLMA